MRMRYAAVMAGLALGLMSGTAQAVPLLFTFSDDLSASFSLDSNPRLFAGNNPADPDGLSSYLADYSDGSALFLGVPATYKGLPQDLNIFIGLPNKINTGVNGMGFISFNPTGDRLGGPGIFTPTGIGLFPLEFNIGHYDFLYNKVAAEGPTVSLDITTVSAVPLPASAPMFGAALLALGAVGYGVKRKKAAAAA